jgi:excisionase family DNA binding protein
MTAVPELFTIPEAAAVLRVPEGWLRKKVTAGAVPHTRLGKHVRFTADHLRGIVGQGEPDAPERPTTPSQGLSARVRRGGPTV